MTAKYDAISNICLLKKEEGNMCKNVKIKENWYL